MRKIEIHLRTSYIADFKYNNYYIKKHNYINSLFIVSRLTEKINKQMISDLSSRTY